MTFGGSGAGEAGVSIRGGGFDSVGKSGTVIGAGISGSASVSVSV
jgi:hypothetical protein